MSEEKDKEKENQAIENQIRSSEKPVTPEERELVEKEKAENIKSFWEGKMGKYR